MGNVSRRDLLSLNPQSTTDDRWVHIASLLVHATHAGCSAVRARVAEIPGAEIHKTGQPGKLAIVLESTDSRAIADTAHEIHHVNGVINVAIVAHLTERESLLDGEDESTSISQA